MKRFRILALALAILLLPLFAACSDTVPEERWVPVTAAPRTTASAPTTEQSALPTEPVLTSAEPAQPTTENSAAPSTEAPAETLPEASTAASTESEAPAPETSASERAPQTEPDETAAPTEAPDRSASAAETEAPAYSYVANTNTKKFHIPTCSSVTDMKESNKWYFTGTRDELIEQGYVPCKRCKP